MFSKLQPPTKRHHARHGSLYFSPSTRLGILEYKSRLAYIRFKRSNITNFVPSFNMKLFALVGLCVHMTALTLAMHYSRISRTDGHATYKASSAVILAEGGKLVAAAFLVLRKRPIEETLAKRVRAVAGLCFQPGWWKLAIPAALFTLQNELHYIALSNLSVPTFQIAMQLKIPATALCCVWMLSKPVTKRQWGAIALLTGGVALVECHPSRGHGGSEEEGSQVVGLLAVLAACLFSGIASVYFEKQLKAPPPLPAVMKSPKPDAGEVIDENDKLWIRNIQLAVASLGIGSFIYQYELRGSGEAASSFLEGFNPLVWVVVALQIAGGLLVALVIKHADNIAKTFATSCSIILSFIISMVLFGYRLDFFTVVGSTAVLVSTFIYSVAPSKATPTAPSKQTHSRSSSTPLPTHRAFAPQLVEIAEDEVSSFTVDEGFLDSKPERQPSEVERRPSKDIEAKYKEKLHAHIVEPQHRRRSSAFIKAVS